MNKRQKKKLNKRIETSIANGFSYLASYRELKELERDWHEYCVLDRRRRKIYREINFDDLVWFDD